MVNVGSQFRMFGGDRRIVAFDSVNVRRAFRMFGSE